MTDRSTEPGPRAFGRSLDPLDGESLVGFVLRFSYRLRLAPPGCQSLMTVWWWRPNRTDGEVRAVVLVCLRDGHGTDGRLDLG
ncbi:hypothetical protein ACQSMD_32890, partial [Streptomyces flavovirens]|uniref:hypothetical protein n=1 Tax=Streptomyces flavovirens TaxID=52258 RepID=UPI003D0C58D5